MAQPVQRLSLMGDMCFTLLVKCADSSEDQRALWKMAFLLV